MAFISTVVRPGGLFTETRSTFSKSWKSRPVRPHGFEAYRVSIPRRLKCPTLSAFEHAAQANGTGLKSGALDDSLSRSEILSQVLQFASPSRVILIASLMSTFLLSLSNMVLPLVFGRVLDAVTLLSSMSSKTSSTIAVSRLLKANFILVICYAWSSILQMIDAVLLKTASERVVITIRKRVFSSLIRADISVFDSVSVSDFISRLSTDTVVLQRVLSDDVSKILQGFTEILVALILLFWLSIRLASILTVCIPIGIAAAMFYGARTAAYARDFSSATAGASATASEFLTGIRTVKVCTREEHAENTYANRLQSVMRLAIRSAWADGLLRSWNKLLFGVSSAVTFYFGGKLVLVGIMTVGTVVSSFIYASNINAGLIKLSTGVGELLRSSGSIHRILQIVRAVPIVECIRPSSGSPENTIPALTSALKHIRGSIEFRNVWFRYPESDRIVLRNVNMKIPVGSNVAIVGKSGGGKSTLTYLLARFYDPVQGEVGIDGTDLRSHNIRHVRKCVLGIVDQEPFLVSGTLADNIRFGREDASAADIESAATAAGVTEFASRFPDGLNTTIVKLSGGERQRIAIARCLVKRPKIIVLDESTSALDAKSEALVSKTINTLMENPQITVILISHRLASVKFCDQIYVFNEGEIVERGTHDELSSHNGEYMKLLAVAR